MCEIDVQLDLAKYGHKIISVEKLKQIAKKPITTLFSDFDGTLIADSHSFDPRVLDAYQRAVKAGMNIFISTGRCFSGVDQIKQEQKFDSLKLYPGLYLNGATVFDEKDKLIYEAFVDSKIIFQLLEFFEKLNYLVTSKPNWEKDNNIFNSPKEFGMPSVVDYTLPQTFIDIGFYSRHTVTFRSETGLTDGLKLYKDGLILYDPQISESLKHMKINKIIILSYSEEIVQKYLKDVVKICNKTCDVTSGLKRSLEVVPKGVNKATGLEYLMNHLNLVRDECCVIGDGLNDLQMIRAFPLSIAMANGVEPVKDSASFVTDSAFDVGWAKAVDQILAFNESFK